MQIKCPCGVTFASRPSLVAVGKGIYCSRKCLYRFRPAPGSGKRADRPVYEDGTAWVAVERIPELGPCHEWRGNRNRHGYGTIWRDGKRWLAHRKVWTDQVGYIPQGLLVLHRCDNPPCVRVDHLELGTHKKNSADMVARDRAYTGEHHGELNAAAKLTLEQISQIRAMYRPRKVTQVMLASMYGVSQSTISSIVLNKTWRK